MQGVANFLDGINKAIARVILWLVVLMVLVQFGIVLGRYVFGVNSIATQESVLYMHSTLFMLAAAYTLLVDKHVRVDVFYARVLPETRRKIDIFGHVFFLIPMLPSAIGGEIGADRSGHGQLCLENSVSRWDYARCVRSGRPSAAGFHGQTGSAGAQTPNELNTISWSTGTEQSVPRKRDAAKCSQGKTCHR